MMEDMIQVMSKMTEQMSHGILTPDEQEAMSQRMAFMSTIMSRMAGLEARPAMTEADWQKQMDEMREQMDEMMRNWQMSPSAR